MPELCRFRGHAVYMDVDMLALEDLRELREMPITHSVMIAAPSRSEVMLIDCGAFRGIEG